MGFFDDFLKPVASIALAASYFTPIGPITGAVTVGAVVAGGATEAIGHATDNEDDQKVGRWFWSMAKDAAIDGVAAGSLGGSRLLSKPVAELAKVGCESWSKGEEEAYRAGGRSYFPTPDPRDTVFFAKNAKTLARGLF
jgi:hypothetical protein